MENGGGRGEPLLTPAIDGDCEKGGGRGRSVVAVVVDDDYHSMLRARDDFFHRFDSGAWKRRNYDLDASAAPNNGSSNRGQRSKDQITVEKTGILSLELKGVVAFLHCNGCGYYHACVIRK